MALPAPPTYTAIYVLCSLTLLYTLGLLIFQIWKRQAKMVKMSSPIMNVVFLIGAAGVLVYVLLLGIDSTVFGDADSPEASGHYATLCHAKFSLLAVSFSLSFGSLFAKLYRLDVIFNSKHLSVQHVRDRDILLMVAALVAADAVLLISWQASTPFYRSLAYSSSAINPSNINEMIQPATEACKTDSFNTWVIVFVAFKGLLLLFGLWLAIRVRKIRVPGLNDSRYIVMSIYQVVLVSVLVILVSVIISDKPIPFYAFVSFCFLYLVCAVLSLLFVPRVLHVLFKWDLTGGSEFTAVGKTHTSGGGDNNNNTTGDSQQLATLKTEMTKLRARLIASQSECNEGRRLLKGFGVELKAPAAPASPVAGMSPMQDIPDSSTEVVAMVSLPGSTDVGDSSADGIPLDAPQSPSHKTS